MEDSNTNAKVTGIVFAAIALAVIVGVFSLQDKPKKKKA